MSAHTPGPLRALKTSIWAGNRHIGISDSPYVSVEAANANAVLWAAAPDLLAALTLLLADVADYPAWQRPCHAVDVARAAIARATGGQS